MPIAETQSRGKVVIETENLVFKPSPIHGLGGFAKGPIEQGARVIEYLGERIDKQESLRRCAGNNEYLFALDETHDLDGNVESNPARFLNHSCEPNCEAQWDDKRIWIVARRSIVSGEEITFNYGYDLEDYRHYACRCGSPECVGVIVAEEFFDHVRKQNRLLIPAATSPAPSAAAAPASPAARTAT